MTFFTIVGIIQTFEPNVKSHVVSRMFCTAFSALLMLSGIVLKESWLRSKLFIYSPLIYVTFDLSMCLLNINGLIYGELDLKYYDEKIVYIENFFMLYVICLGFNVSYIHSIIIQCLGTITIYFVVLKDNELTDKKISIISAILSWYLVNSFIIFFIYKNEL